MIRFIHIRKNGGTSTYKFLRSNGVDFVCGDSKDIFNVYNQHIPAGRYASEDSWKFCIIRNPYSRIVSFYNWTRRDKKRYGDISFECFVKSANLAGRGQHLWELQTDFILDVNNNNLIDKMFKFETITEEIPKYFNIKSKFPHLNQSTTDNFKKYYNDELQEIVYTKLEKDFEYLGYNKCLT